MVERVAKAILAVGHGTGQWETCLPYEREFVMQEAAAAIKEMREPTISMVNKARCDKPFDQDCQISWKLMIDEALKEKV